MTDLIHPLFAEADRKQPDAPFRAPAFGPHWTEADHAAGLARAAELVRQVIARMPPRPVEAIPAPSPSTEPAFEETSAFKAAVAALVEG